MLRAALILALVCGACIGTAHRGATTTAGASSKPAASARGVLVAYLNATYGGFHARGYSLLTRADQSRMSRSAYIEEQRNLSAMRGQDEPPQRRPPPRWRVPLDPGPRPPPTRRHQPLRRHV